jgi:hypothetical protein
VKADADPPPSTRPEALRSLAGVVAAARTTNWEGFPAGMCRDCYVTIMMLQRRDAGGAEQTYLFYWDDMTAGKVPENVKRVYDTALALASGRQ